MTTTTEITLDNIQSRNKKLEKRFSSRIEINKDLKRTLVSFQANKKEPGYRWFKFKEGYSAALVDYVLSKLKVKSGKLIDPFAGSGTSLFASSEAGIDSVGIEVLPIGTEIIEVRQILIEGDKKYFLKTLSSWLEKQPWKNGKKPKPLHYLNITKGAFPSNTEESIGRYLLAVEKEKNTKLKRILRFALLCILEEVSYTRKDGQYLRWDYRSERTQGANPFDKGYIKTFDEAIIEKLRTFYEDLQPNSTLLDIYPKAKKPGKIEIVGGSCLSLLPKIKSNTFDLLMTSPPYCNRYDYTRTYALELALLGISEEKLKSLRQEMMSCTVENREKPELQRMFSKATFTNALSAFDSQPELQEILEYLNQKKESRALNNPGILRMVKNYFFEMSLIIFECARVLKKNAPFVMVNDNVRYAGANIPVDLILSDIAEKAGFYAEKIWILPTGKGNSSQQMGAHGREEQRKCVYVWQCL